MLAAEAAGSAFSRSRSVNLAVLLGMNRMSLSCISKSVAFELRIFFKLTGISCRPCALVRIKRTEALAAVEFVPCAKASRLAHGIVKPAPAAPASLSALRRVSFVPLLSGLQR